MTFLEKIKPHLVSNDPLIQETVLHALHDFPNVPEEWTVQLLEEAFNHPHKLTSILIYVEKQTINEEAVKILLKYIPMVDKSKVHLALNLLNHINPERALKYKNELQKYISNDMWSLYELLLTGTEEEVYAEYAETINALERADSYQHEIYIKAKKLAACIAQNDWITEDEIDIIIRKELTEQWFSFNGILTVYIIGLLKLEKHIPFLASILVRDEDLLLEEAAVSLISFQSDAVIKEVEPYLKREDSIIFAASIVENIKSKYAVQVLRESYRTTEINEDHELLIEALCHQLSEEALPEISQHMETGYSSGLVDMEQTVYSYFSILGLEHPDLENWREAAMESEMNSGFPSNVPTPGEMKVGRNDPCPCGSGKKYKKCCGK